MSSPSLGAGCVCASCVCVRVLTSMLQIATPRKVAEASEQLITPYTGFVLLLSLDNVITQTLKLHLTWMWNRLSERQKCTIPSCHQCTWSLEPKRNDTNTQSRLSYTLAVSHACNLYTACRHVVMHHASLSHLQISGTMLPHSSS